MTGRRQHPSVDSDHWSVKPADLAQVAAPAHIHPAGPGKGRFAKSTKRITHSLRRVLPALSFGI